MNPYEPPRPWDDPRYDHLHRGRGPMEVVRGGPIELEFKGWRSDTYRLQQCGWQIAETRRSSFHRDDPYGETWGIQIRHPELGISGTSRPIQRGNSIHMRQRFRHGDGCHDIYLDIDLGMPYMVREYGDRMPQFMAVDTTPYHMEVRDPYDLYNQPYFKPVADSKEIFLREASVDEIMEIALSKQEPERARISMERQRDKRLAEYRRGGEEKARIIMVA